MKKRIIVIFTVLSFTIIVQGQLSVTSTGQVQIGTGSVNQTADAISSFVIWPHSTGSALNAENYMTFGTGSNNSIGTTGKVFTIRALNGIQLYSTASSNIKRLFNYTPSGNVFTFSVDVKAPSFLTTSDARLKSNVEALEDSYLKLAYLNPVSFTYTSEFELEASENEETKKDSSIENEIIDSAANRTHFGFLAQEVRDIYPNLVVEDEEGMLAIDYTGFIPLLVDAIRNLTAQVQKQQDTIDELKGISSPTRKSASINHLEEDGLYLSQNKPNPFNAITSIDCYLPQSVDEATLYIYDLRGKQVKKFDIIERGTVTVNVDAEILESGIYIYSLMANGTEVASKRMIITD